MITIKEGNLFDVKHGIIAHQVNCWGVMGSGVAEQFKACFPTSYKWYRKECNSVKTRADLLGKNINCYEDDEAIITVCMFAQENYGYNDCFTDYSAFRSCCKQLAYDINALGREDETINMPYLIGCGRAGGDWNIVFNIIYEELNDFDVILWRL